jgi:hypothetical protein
MTTAEARAGVELLTEENGRVVRGPTFPADLGVAATRYVDDDPRGHYEFARSFKFFQRDRHGRPLPHTLVQFYVPDRLCENGQPTPRAVELVSERMGWGCHDGR